MQSKNAYRLSALLAAYSAVSYSSDYTYGQTSNAASAGYNWVMQNVLPQVQGLDINGVIYRYTAVKNPADPMQVHVQNEDARGGYIFRETDDWSGRPGATIRKQIPVANSPAQYWGDGSIQVDGQGTVENASVVYTYRIDPCADPQSNPSCPGYVEPVEPVEIPKIAIPEVPAMEPLPERDTPVQPPVATYDLMRDALVAQALQPTNPDLYDREPEEKDDEEKEESLEKALATSDADLEMALGQAAMLQAMNSVKMTNYYAMTIPGGVYRETVVLQGGEIKDNKRAFRSMANDRLHTEMVEEQWK